MQKRECVCSRQISEAQHDHNTIWVKKTKEVKKDISFERLTEIHEELLEKRSKPTKELLKEINNRGLGGPKQRERPTT
jgi:hypothetical protein